MTIVDVRRHSLKFYFLWMLRSRSKPSKSAENQDQAPRRPSSSLRCCLFIMILPVIALVLIMARTYESTPFSISSLKQYWEAHDRKAPSAEHLSFKKSKSRIVAIGDFHGDWDSATTVLKMAGLIDDKFNWAGGNTRFVQTVSYPKTHCQGDIVDRGPDTIALYQLMIKLANQAEAVGGRVYALLGNHEIMNMMQDLRYVTPEDTASFGGESKRREAWSQEGWLGKYVRSLNISAIVDGTVFVHGGIHPDWAKYGVDVSLLADSQSRNSTRKRNCIYQKILKMSCGTSSYSMVKCRLCGTGDMRKMLNQKCVKSLIVL